MPAIGWNVDVPTAEYYGELPDQKWAKYIKPGDIHQLLRDLEGVDEIAIDTETTGLIVWRCVPLYFSLAWGRRRATLHSSLLPFFKRLFENPRKRWILANAKFDMHMLANRGCYILGPWLDVAVEHALLYEDMSHGLKDICKQQLGWKWSDFQDTFGRINAQQTPTDLIRRAEEENFPLLVEYAANDAWGTLNAHWALKQKLQEAQTHSLFRLEPPYIETLWDLFYKTEVPYTKVLWKNERRGIMVDLPTLKAAKPKAEHDINELEKKIAKLVGGIFNPRSTPQLKRMFLDEYGVPPLKMTKGGKTGVRQPSLDSTFLEHYANYNITGHEANANGLRKAQCLASLILEHRDVSKLYGTYIVGLNKLVDPDSRIHTRFNQDVARTGRLSSADPNL